MGHRKGVPAAGVRAGVAVLFYIPREPYGCFSNFYRTSFIYKSRMWDFSEAPYQADKFYDQALVDQIHKAKKPREAADIGRAGSPVREDWDKPPLTVPAHRPPEDGIKRIEPPEPLFSRVKDVCMFEVCLAKFQQNADIREILLGTKDEPIIEASPKDGYWGWGAVEIGQNKLGRVLMVVRDVLR